MSTLRKVALCIIAGGNLVVGLWAQGFPRSFYDDFPGVGRRRRGELKSVRLT